MEKEEVPLKIAAVERLRIVSDQPKNDRHFLKSVWDVITHKIYILSWIRYYDQHKAISDLIAGITLGLTLIPQSLAYASLAGLQSQYGLYAAFMGSIVYVFFGTVPQVSIGPTNLMSILIITYTYQKPIEYVFIFAFLTGCVELMMGIFKLGFIVDFISAPVTSAFTTGTSLIIISSQLKSLTGLQYTSKGFSGMLWNFFTRIQDIKLGDTVLGLICLVVLVFLKKIKEIIKPTNKKTEKALWYFSISSNALVVLISSTVAFFWGASEVPFELTGTVASGIPSFQLPPFVINDGNTTIGFPEIVADLGSGLIFLPLVAILANVAIAKAFSSGKTVDASQEMIALGMANILGSFFMSMPTTGAFTRSAVSNASGVQTPMAGIYSAIMALLALSLLTPYFYYIPGTTLAAVLICAAYFMIDFAIITKLWKQNKRDLVCWVACFLACIVKGVEFGLLVGMVINMMNLLYMWARPHTNVQIVEDDNLQYIRVQPIIGVLYPGIDFLREKVNRAAAETEYKIPVAIDCSRISGFDYTSSNGLVSLAKDLEKQNLALILLYLDLHLQNSIIPHENILICESLESLKQMLIDKKVKNLSTSLQQFNVTIDSNPKVST